MGWFSSKVTVTFIDDSSGQPFAITEIPPTDLPETFELDTTLHLGNEDWSVIDAQPKTRAEFTKSKKLTLRLSRVVMMDPSKILFSLPCICSALPSVNDISLTGNEFILTEDDWRQLELVSRDLADVVDEEIEKVRLIHKNARAEYGWREIHVRSRPDLPITCNLGLADLADAMQVSSVPSGITYRGAQTQITDGYSMRSNGLTLYGVAPNGLVQVIAVEQYSSTTPNAVAIDQFRALSRDMNLDLVNWCRCARIGPEDPLFDALLSNTAT